jgi:hypothetical protein
MLARIRTWLAGRKDGARAAAPPDWAAIDDYSTLYREIPRARFADQRAFVEGPFRRYLDLVEAAPGRAGARIMEHVRASLSRYQESEAAQGRSTDWLEREADALVRARFAGDGENGLYMIEVFEGRATHNWRASEEEEEVE